MSQKFIEVRGAREHNLKNIDVKIPREQLVVLTGLSGSGKSSLAFDTIFAEGQRRYVESLSSYARMFLGQMNKPDVDSIDGLSPAISIDQKSTSNNPRSTVGTVTEIYDFLRLLYARTGVPHCPQCGRVIESQSVDQILKQIMDYPDGTRLIVMAPVVRSRKGTFAKLFDEFRQNGFMRVRVDGETRELEEEIVLEKNKKHSVELVIDRLVKRESNRTRVADSVETAMHQSDGMSLIEFQVPIEEGEYEIHEELFSQNFACAHCNISIGEITPQLFSFNNPHGACAHCSGLGTLMHIDPDMIVSEPDLSINEGAIHAGGWNFDDPNSWGRAFAEALARTYEFSVDTPYRDLSDEVKRAIMYGTDGRKMDVDTSNSKYYRGEDYRAAFQGLVPSLEQRYQAASSEELRNYYGQYMSINTCPVCHGARLRAEALGVTVGDLNIYELTKLSIADSYTYLKELEFESHHRAIAKQINGELEGRLSFLLDVGLDYITLDRSASTLSGGEAQRIRLATQIGSGLMGVLYILDEPSIGLHQRDNGLLIRTLKHLRDLGNTVLVVEHDEETMWEADHIIDLGPGAGASGGHVVAQGTARELCDNPVSLTGQYLSGRKKIEIPEHRRAGNGHQLKIKGAAENNLKAINVDIPLGTLTCVTGVSGSGKSSLINEVLLKRLEIVLNRARRKVGRHKAITGYENLDKVISIDQSPIGRTPRSNPATYTGVFDLIRKFYAELPDAKAKGYKPGRFSFNVKGGRCEACRGDGVNKIEMHFLPDVFVPCEVCGGKRYNHETLEVKYKGKNIADILDLTVEEAVEFFHAHAPIVRKIQTLMDVGLGYTKLGQLSTELSGGEAQRVKLATELSRRSTGKTLYILDEPTTGLHVHDIRHLIDILQQLVETGNTVIVIEHNLDVIKTADYIIDLGPEGGENGGELIACGTPEHIATINESATGMYLRKILTTQQNE
ncbi:MAG: excinuclease ABC subunit UvrA [Fastidiosipilaceae bacterium]